MKHLEEQIATVEKEYSELEEIWRADKALVAGNKDIQVKLDQARIALEKAQREGDLAEAARYQYGVIPELQNSWNALKRLKKVKRQNCCVTKSLTMRSLK